MNGDTSCPDHIVQVYLLLGVNVGLSETEVFHCLDLFKSYNGTSGVIQRDRRPFPDFL